MSNQKARQKEKVFVIGIDSATFDVITPMIKEGKLPNLAKLIEEGCSGELESTFPPVTPPAWVSFMTGKNPGKHGVFDFYASPSYGYDRPLFNSNYIKSKTVFSILSEADKYVGTINVPMTYPPEKINGFMIPGIQYGIGVDKNFSHPPELMQSITKEFGDYQIAYGNLTGFYSHELDNFITQWKKIHKTREQVLLYLMDKYPLDFFMAVFYSIDTIQHIFWKYSDHTHPLYDERESKKYSSVIKDFYQMIDISIGKILEKLDTSAKVIVASDHGMGIEHKAFYLNSWLINEGSLQLRKGLYPYLKFKFPHFFYRILNELNHPGVEWSLGRNERKVLKNKIDPRDGLRISHFIDWSKTKAYAGNHTEQGLYINLKGREPMGVVEPGKEYEDVRDGIIDKLYQVVDPETGQKVFDKIFKKEELYFGPQTKHAPDISFIMNEATYLSHKEIHYKELFRVDERSSGTHRLHGIFIINGKGIKKNTALNGCKIIDMAPTILYAMGLPIPEDMDGTVVFSAFEDDYVKMNPVNYDTNSKQNTLKDEGIFSDEDSEKIKETLRNLGYIG